LARATMAPASKTPNPNRWLNSRPTPFIVQWKRPLASNREFRLEVSTVKCCMSLHVSCGLQHDKTNIVILIVVKWPTDVSRNLLTYSLTYLLAYLLTYSLTYLHAYLLT
jgi:hypothetical protein